MRVLHNNILYIAKYFDKFCKENDLNYFLLGGTALGAERHGGFIPWDDDFDVCMLKNDYLKLLDLASKFDNSEFYLQKENSEELPLFFSKLRLNNSEYFEEDDFNRSGHNGVYIDIMCISPSYSSQILTFLQYFVSKILSANALSNRGYKHASFKKKFLLYISNFLPKFFIPYLLAFARNDFKLNVGNYHVHFFGRAPFKKGLIRNDYLLPSTINFEDHLFSCFNKNREYLKNRFGDDCFLIPNQTVRDKYPPHCVKFVSHPNLNYEL